MLTTLLIVLVAAGADRPVTVNRAHKPGQVYDISFRAFDALDGKDRSRTEARAVATVDSVSGEFTQFTLRIKAWEFFEHKKAGWERTGSNSGVDLKVEVGKTSIDAEVTTADADAEQWAKLHLTQFEMMMGDLCRPPEDTPIGRPSSKDATGWLLDKLNGRLAVLRQVPPRVGAGVPTWSCDSTVSLDDGFSGTRKGSFTMFMPMPDGASHPSTQRYELEVKRGEARRTP